MTLYSHLVYSLCLFASVTCTALLYRGYRRSRIGLLFWSALCFVFLSVSNLLLYVDVGLLIHPDLRLARMAANLTAAALLLYGFLMEPE